LSLVLVEQVIISMVDEMFAMKESHPDSKMIEDILEGLKPILQIHGLDRCSVHSCCDHPHLCRASVSNLIKFSKPMLRVVPRYANGDC
jgi:hypothetical protein